jgi:hypothetical protein
MLSTRYYLWLTALLGAVSACTSCSKAPASETDADSGGVEQHDAGRMDGGDLPELDAGSAEAGADANDPFSVGEWNKFPGAQPNCGLLLAADPGSSVGPMKWQPCASGRAGCQKLVADWTANPQGATSLNLRRSEPVRLIQGQPYLTYERFYLSGMLDYFDSEISIVQPLTGAPVFAIGARMNTPDFCSPASAIGEYGVGFIALAPSNDSYLLGWGTWQAPTSISTFVAPTSSTGQLQGVMIGSAQLFLDRYDGETIGLFDLATHTTKFPAPFPVHVEVEKSTPDGAMALSSSYPYSIVAIKPDASYATVVTPISPQLVTAFALDRANGNALVWDESDDAAAGYANPVIWTSPYATTPGALVRRKVALYTDNVGRGGADMVANAGVVLNVIDLDKALITRLSDGMGWLITAEPGDAFYQPAWVDDTEAWLVIGKKGVSTPDPSGIMRLTRASLGAPTVPRGF